MGYCSKCGSADSYCTSCGEFLPCSCRSGLLRFHRCKPQLSYGLSKDNYCSSCGEAYPATEYCSGCGADITSPHVCYKGTGFSIPLRKSHICRRF